MSHFTVLVTAKDDDDLVAIMAPFKEEPDDPRYREFSVEVPKGEFRQRKAQIIAENADYAEKYTPLSPAKVFDAWYGGNRGPNGDWGYWRNPNAQWDWYQVGGRWSGKLQLKYPMRESLVASNGDGGAFNQPNTDPMKADRALAREINWTAMKETSAKRLHEKWQAWRDLNGKYKVGLLTDSEFRNALWDAGCGMIRDDEAKALDETDEDTYVAQCLADQGLTWAFIDKQGKWHEWADMGWWGCYGDTKSGYGAEWWAFVESLDPEDIVHVLDCHI